LALKQQQKGVVKFDVLASFGIPTFLTKPGYTYLAIFYDNGHCPLTVRAGEWAAVVTFGWLHGDAFTTAQANYSWRALGASLVLSLMAG
jgi:hypothetical protein